jgi:hypothetical protein
MSFVSFIIGFIFGIALTIRFPHVPTMANELIKRARSGEDITKDLKEMKEVKAVPVVKEDKEISKPGT